MVKATLSETSDIYSLYAAGALDPAFSLMLETQAALRADTARALANAEILAGCFLETEAPLAPKDTALDTVFAMIDAAEARDVQLAKAAGRAHGAIDEVLSLPDPLRDRVLDTFENKGWDSLTKGVQRVTLDIASDAEVELYRIEPGQKLPKHSHKASEFTLVVAGGYTDETGQFGPGDLSYKGPEDIHQPMADMDGVCFALAVRDDGLKFTGLLGVAQRLLGQ